MAMPCGVGGTHRWPGGRGGRPRALIPGEGVREGLAWRGKGSEESKGFGSGRVGVLFFESWRVDLVTCRARFASSCLGVREGLAWRGKGSGGVQGLRFRGG